MKNYLKRNKPLLFLPLVLIPFIVLIFYILGGGKLSKKETEVQKKQETSKGPNYKLPEADRNIRIFDKMESAQSQKEMGTTHDYDIMGEKDSLSDAQLMEDQSMSENNVSHETEPGPELNADVSNNLLAHIRQQEQQARKDLQNGQDADQSRNNIQESGSEKDTKSSGQSETDSQRETASQVKNPTGIEELDKVFKQNIALSHRNDSLNNRLQDATGQLQTIEARKNKRFALEKNAGSGFKPSEKNSSMIEAEIYETMTVLTGNRVKLRLLYDCWLNGTKIPANTFLYGICKADNERLQIEVTQIPVKEKFVSVEINVCDLDGLPGLYVPDNASRKVAKEVGSSTNTSSMFGVTNNPLTYAGIQAADRTAQSLLKMIKLKKVTIKKNTLVYLINKTN
jgi:conjugative transposon TraM protein